MPFFRSSALGALFSQGDRKTFFFQTSYIIQKWCWNLPRSLSQEHRKPCFSNLVYQPKMVLESLYGSRLGRQKTIFFKLDILSRNGVRIPLGPLVRKIENHFFQTRYTIQKRYQNLYRTLSQEDRKPFFKTGYTIQKWCQNLSRPFSQEDRKPFFSNLIYYPEMVLGALVRKMKNIFFKLDILYYPMLESPQ